jgi:hypothetical protein
MTDEDIITDWSNEAEAEFLAMTWPDPDDAGLTEAAIVWADQIVAQIIERGETPRQLYARRAALPPKGRKGIEIYVALLEDNVPGIRAELDEPYGDAEEDTMTDDTELAVAALDLVAAIDAEQAQWSPWMERALAKVRELTRVDEDDEP